MVLLRGLLTRLGPKDHHPNAALLIDRSLFLKSCRLLSCANSAQGLESTQSQLATVGQKPEEGTLRQNALSSL